MLMFERPKTTRVQRPDAALRPVEGVQYGLCCAYGEVKIKDTDVPSKVFDLARSAIFAKDCIDTNKLIYVMVFHAHP